MGVDGLWHVDYLRGNYPPPPGLSNVPEGEGFETPDCIFYPINTEQKNVCCITEQAGGPVWAFSTTDPPEFEPYIVGENIQVYLWNQ